MRYGLQTVAPAAKHSECTKELAREHGFPRPPSRTKSVHPAIISHEVKQSAAPTWHTAHRESTAHPGLHLARSQTMYWTSVTHGSQTVVPLPSAADGSISHDTGSQTVVPVAKRCGSKCSLRRSPRKPFSSGLHLLGQSERLCVTNSAW